MTEFKTTMTTRTFFNGKEEKVSREYTESLPDDYWMGTSYYDCTDLKKYSFYFNSKTGMRSDQEEDGYIRVTGNILTPKSDESNMEYPVLYLLHGAGANSEWTCSSKGNIQQVIGYMIKSGKLKQPMIIVMPDVFKIGSSGSCEKENDYKSLLDFLPVSGGLMEYINENFRTLKGRLNTSIAGLSMGGLAALYLSCNLQDYFCSVGSFSPAVGLFASKNPLSLCYSPDGRYPEDVGKARFVYKESNFMFIARGTEDTSIGQSPESYVNTLTENRSDNIFCTLPGNHNWDCFRLELYLFLQNNIFNIS